MTVEHCHDNRLPCFHHVAHDVWEASDQSLPNVPVYNRVQLGRLVDAIENRFNTFEELAAQTGSLVFVPKVSLKQIGFRFRLDSYPPGHDSPRILRFTSFQSEAGVSEESRRVKRRSSSAF